MKKLIAIGLVLAFLPVAGFANHSQTQRTRHSRCFARDSQRRQGDPMIEVNNAVQCLAWTNIENDEVRQEKII